MGRQRGIANIALAGSVLLGACGPIKLGPRGQIDGTEPRTAQQTPTPTFTPEPTSTPTVTPGPTNTPTPQPTATPSYEELQRLKPQGVEGEVVMGEEGRPQLRTELGGYDVGEGLVFAEYENGNWNLVPFEFVRTKEMTNELLDVYPNYFQERSGEVFDVNYSFPSATIRIPVSP